MSAVVNKQLMQSVFSEMAKGNSRPFVDSMAEDFCWTISGKSKWAGTYRGKRAVLDDLMKPLFEHYADRYTSTARRIIADDEYAVVECQGRVTTLAGKLYNNEYCLVIRMAEGKMSELTEYMDTEFATAAFDW